MKTYENNTIRVTIPDEEYERLREDVSSFNPLQRVEQVVRGLVLSNAMEALGNRSEVKLLEQEGPQITPEDVRRIAREFLAFDYLNNNTKYREGEAFLRWRTGRIMPEGMHQELQSALSYASGCLSPIDREEAIADLRKIYRSDKHRHEQDREVQHVVLRLGNNAQGCNAVTEATKYITDQFEVELSYRNRCCNWDYQIEIIGEMPEQIGMCRFDKAVV